MYKSSMIFAIVAILTPISMSAQKQHPSNQHQRDAQQASQPIAITTNCNCTSHDQNDKDKPHGWHKLVTWPEGVATWALILTLGAIVWQSVETRRATNSQRSKDRARLFVEVSDGPDYVDFKNLTPSSLGYWSLGIEVTQHGSTKAFNLTGRAIVIVRPAKEKRPRFPRWRMLPLIGLPPMVEDKPNLLIEGAIGFKAVDNLVLDRINREKSCIHFLGEIQYQDIFNASRKTTFRYTWVPEWRERIPGGEPGNTFVVQEARWKTSGKKADNRAY